MSSRLQLFTVHLRGSGCVLDYNYLQYIGWIWIRSGAPFDLHQWQCAYEDLANIQVSQVSCLYSFYSVRICAFIVYLLFV